MIILDGKNLEMHRVFVRDYDGSFLEISQRKIIATEEEQQKIMEMADRGDFVILKQPTQNNTELN
jgi:hypothetical protein